MKMCKNENNAKCKKAEKRMKTCKTNEKNGYLLTNEKK